MKYGAVRKFSPNRLYMSNDTHQYKCGGVKAYKKGKGLASGCCPSLKNAAKLPNLNFPGETACKEWFKHFPQTKASCINFQRRGLQTNFCHELLSKHSFAEKSLKK